MKLSERLEISIVLTNRVSPTNSISQDDLIAQIQALESKAEKYDALAKLVAMLKEKAANWDMLAKLPELTTLSHLSGYTPLVWAVIDDYMLMDMENCGEDYQKKHNHRANTPAEALRKFWDSRKEQE